MHTYAHGGGGGDGGVNPHEGSSPNVREPATPHPTDPVQRAVIVMHGMKYIMPTK